MPDTDHASCSTYYGYGYGYGYGWLCLMQIIATSGAMVVYLPVGERSVLIWWEWCDCELGPRPMGESRHPSAVLLQW